MRLPAVYRLFLLIGCVPIPGASAQVALCDRLRAMTQETAVASAHWGVSVVSADGSAVCGINEAQLFRPASNNKLFTTAAAFSLLGPESTVETRVLGTLDMSTGVVSGDLILQGGADANLDSNDLPYVLPSQRGAARPFAFHDLEDLAAQLAAKGVRSVTGDVVGDDSLFPYEPYPPSWNADDLVWGYGAPVSALSVADNQLRLTITPSASQESSTLPLATVVLEQHGVAYYTVQNEVRTVPKGAVAGIGVERLPGSRVIRVFGLVAEGAPDSEEIAIDDPAMYAAMAFRLVLNEHGISTSGVARAVHHPLRDGRSFLSEIAPAAPTTSIGPGVVLGESSESCVQPAYPPVLAEYTSALLRDDAVFTMKTSQNLHAELLLRRVDKTGNCEVSSDVLGVRAVRRFLLRAGVAANDFLLYDGSGLSDHDLVAPRAFTRLLTFAAAQPWFAGWRATLPVGGVDGSLTARFGEALKGRVLAKTGTLGESRALSGYVTTDAGKVLAFSILVDTHLPGGSADRAVMDRMVEAMAEAR